MSKRKLSFACDGDNDYSCDEASSSDSDCEGVEIAHALWPDAPLLNQVVTVECGVRGSFDVPRGCLDKQRWATAFTSGATRAVSTSSCMQALAFWTSAISFRFLQAWAALILSHRRPFEWNVPCCDRMTLTMAAIILRRRAWLQRVLLGSAAVRFDIMVECCNKNAFSRQETQIELALDAVFSAKVSSKEELITLLTHLEEDARDVAEAPDGDSPRLKVNGMDSDQYLAYLRRYLRRNANSPARTQTVVALIEHRQQSLFSPERDFDIQGVDAVEPEFLRITQGGASKRVKEDQVSGNPTSRPRWLRWKARTAKRLQELENRHSHENPKVLE